MMMMMMMVVVVVVAVAIVAGHTSQLEQSIIEKYESHNNDRMMAPHDHPAFHYTIA